jgi:hypothetical protein
LIADLRNNLKDVRFADACKIADLIRLHGIKEGKWLIGFEFGLGAGIVGPSPEMQRPGAIVAINRLTLTRHTEVIPELLPFVVDAAEVNSCSD